MTTSPTSHYSLTDYIAHNHVLESLKSGVEMYITNEIGLSYQFIGSVLISNRRGLLVLSDQRGADTSNRLLVEKISKIRAEGDTIGMEVFTDGSVSLQVRFSPPTEEASLEQWCQVLRAVATPTTDSTATATAGESSSVQTPVPLPTGQQHCTPMTSRRALEKKEDLLQTVPTVMDRQREGVDLLRTPESTDEQLSLICDSLEQRLERLKEFKQWLSEDDLSRAVVDL